MNLDGLQFRCAAPPDAQAVAELHADSWRHHYRGAYSDAFLDGDVLADRLAVWAAQLRETDPRRCTILAQDGGLVGFANTFFDEDPVWGALLDNLHVVRGSMRRGVGSHLLSLTGQAVVRRAGRSGLYLWVLEQNVDAQAFYRARGGTCVERALVDAPGGVAGRLNGSPAKLRYAWPNAEVLRSSARWTSS